MDETTALRALAEDLAARLAGWHPDIRPDLPPPQLLPATVPDDLPAPLPLPDDATIIGTVRHTAPALGPVQTLLLLVDTPLTVEQVRAFYEDCLVRAGWSEVQMQGRDPGAMGGFVHTTHAVAVGFALTATHDAVGMHLTLDAHRAPDGTARVQMVAVVYPPGSPWIAGRAVSHLHSTLRYPHGLLPPLPLPPGTIVISGGGRGSTTSNVESAMDVETDMDRAILAAFFTPQLEQAGWTQQDAGEDGALTWSTWAFVDPAGAPWRGVLHVLRCPERARRHRLSLVAEWPPRHD
jgi:hypothetical protein